MKKVVIREEDGMYCIYPVETERRMVEVHGHAFNLADALKLVKEFMV